MSILDKITSEYGDFNHIDTIAGSSAIDAFCTKMHIAYCKTYTADAYLTSMEWMIRHYMASKKIVLSSVFFCSRNILQAKDSRI